MSGRGTDLSEISNINSSESANGPQHRSITGCSGRERRSWALDRAIAVYRLKYVCAQPCSVFCRSVLSRVPSGKKVYVILLMLGLEQLAYSASSDYLLYPFLYKVDVGMEHVNLVRSIVTYIVGFLMFPVMGWIADVWVGQYRMIHFSLWLLWAGYAALALLYSACPLDPKGTPLYLLPLLFAVISIGHSGFQANAIPFGAEVIKYRTSQELSSYFHCYYWMRNFGLTLFFITANCRDLSEKTQEVVYTMVACVCISLALVLNGIFHRWYDATRERVNPYKKVLQVLYLAVVIKRPVHRSAFSFTGAEPPSRISLTKEVHGGKFTSAEVEDVKTFLRLLGVLLCMLFALITYAGVTQAMPTQLHDLHSKVLTGHFSIGHLSCEFSDKFVIAANVSLVLLLIPLLNFIIYPFLREYMPNMLKRIGLGVLLAVLAQFAVLAMSGVGSRRTWINNTSHEQCMFSTNFNRSTPLVYDYSNVSEFYVLLPHLLITVAEILVNVTSLEFFYAQSPHQMRGMMIGLFFFIWGLASANARIMMTAFGRSRSATPMTCDFWFNLFYMMVAVVGLACYLLVARRYRNRQRGEQDSDRFYRPPQPPLQR